MHRCKIDFSFPGRGNWIEVFERSYSVPVNMDPAKKRRRAVTPSAQPDSASKPTSQGHYGEETEEDRQKALADAEKKNLWDATEVIDMDTF